MKESTKKKWAPMVGVFLAVSGSFAALMYLSISTFSTGQNQPAFSFFRFQQNDTPADGSQELSRRMFDLAPVPAGWSKTVLRLDRDSSVGNILLTYRGKQGRSAFRLDVIIPDLDPQSTYRREINIKKARKGFQVDNERFVLLSAGNARISLLHYTPAR